MFVVAGASGVEPVEFGDVRLKATVERTLGKADPNAADMLRLEKLDAANMRISSISGLEHALNLGYLRLTSNRVRDISALAEMRKLAFLDLSSNAVEDIGSLLRLRCFSPTPLMQTSVPLCDQSNVPSTGCTIQRVALKFKP